MTPTPEQIAKLPKWAQDYVKTLARQRDAAIRDQAEYLDTQTESSFFVEEYTTSGSKRRYVQADTIICEYAGVRLEVSAHAHNNQNANCIRVKWGAPNRSMDEIAMVPEVFQTIRLITKENMR